MSISAKCKTCQHKEIDRINEMLVSGVSSYKVADMFGLNDRGIRLHREKHLPKTLVKAQALKEESAADKLLEQIEKIYNKVWSIAEQAESNRKYQSAVAALKEARMCLELTGKLIGELKTGNTINIHYSSAWIQLRGTIFDVLREFPEARLKLADELSKIEETEVIEVEAVERIEENAAVD